MKYGLISGASGTENTALQWYANSQSQWNVTFEPGVWHNVAYEIDFSGGSVTFWHSTGSDALTKTAGPVSVSASSNGADWHLGVLRLEGNTDATAEDWYFSGVYIESGDLTTEIGSGSSSSSGSSSASASPAAAAAVSSSASSAAAPASTVAAQETTSSAAAVASTTSSAAAVATPTTLQTLVSSAAASSSAAAQPTGQTGSVPATSSNGGDDSSDSSSSTTTSGNGLSADEQEEVNQGIYSWYQSLKAWWSANQ